MFGGTCHLHRSLVHTPQSQVKRSSSRRSGKGNSLKTEFLVSPVLIFFCSLSNTEFLIRFLVMWGWNYFWSTETQLNKIRFLIPQFGVLQSAISFTNQNVCQVIRSFMGIIFPSQPFRPQKKESKFLVKFVHFSYLTLHKPGRLVGQNFDFGEKNVPAFGVWKNSRHRNGKKTRSSEPTRISSGEVVEAVRFKWCTVQIPCCHLMWLQKKTPLVSSFETTYLDATVRSSWNSRNPKRNLRKPYTPWNSETNSFAPGKMTFRVKMLPLFRGVFAESDTPLKTNGFCTWGPVGKGKTSTIATIFRASIPTILWGLHNLEKGWEFSNPFFGGVASSLAARF